MKCIVHSGRSIVNGYFIEISLTGHEQVDVWAAGLVQGFVATAENDLSFEKVFAARS